MKTTRADILAEAERVDLTQGLTCVRPYGMGFRAVPVGGDLIDGTNRLGEMRAMLAGTHHSRIFRAYWMIVTLT